MKKLIIAALLIFSSASYAVDQHVMMIGTGTMSCGKFIDYKNQGNKAQMDLYVQWVWGFLSAYNSRGSFITNSKYVDQANFVSTIPDSPTVILFLTKNCEQHPLESLVPGVYRLVKSLGGVAFVPQ